MKINYLDIVFLAIVVISAIVTLIKYKKGEKKYSHYMILFLTIGIARVVQIIGRAITPCSSLDIVRLLSIICLLSYGFFHLYIATKKNKIKINSEG